MATTSVTEAKNFKVTLNGDIVNPINIEYNAAAKAIMLKNIAVAQYDQVAVVYTTNE